MSRRSRRHEPAPPRCHAMGRAAARGCAPREGNLFRICKLQRVALGGECGEWNHQHRHQIRAPPAQQCARDRGDAAGKHALVGLQHEGAHRIGLARGRGEVGLCRERNPAKVVGRFDLFGGDAFAAEQRRGMTFTAMIFSMPISCRISTGSGSAMPPSMSVSRFWPVMRRSSSVSRATTVRCSTPAAIEGRDTMRCTRFGGDLSPTTSTKRCPESRAGPAGKKGRHRRTGTPRRPMSPAPCPFHAVKSPQSDGYTCAGR